MTDTTASQGAEPQAAPTAAPAATAAPTTQGAPLIQAAPAAPLAPADAQIPVAASGAFGAPSTPTAPSVAPQQSSGRQRSKIGFGRVMLTVLHLAALGMLGTVVFVVAATVFSLGIGLSFAFGIGLILLVGLVYTLFGVAWLEVERVRGLYSLDTGALRLRPREHPGFGGWLQAMLKQSVDGRMWASLLSLAIGTVFGLLVIRLAASAVWSFVIMFGGSALGNQLGVWRLFGPEISGFQTNEVADSFSSPLWSLSVVVLSLAAMIGLGALHALIVRGLLGSPSRSELAATVRVTSAQREGAVRAADLERTRIERDLHDGVQPRLVSIGMTLGLAQQKIDEDPAAAKALVSEAHTSTKAAITELRQLARGIHASVLDDRGLDAALSALAGRSHVPVLLDVRMDGSADLRQQSSVFRDAEAAVYFSIAEALTNAAKHSRAAECRVVVRLRDAGTPGALIWARVEDNGIGGATLQPGGGLDGISNRVLAAGGNFSIVSPNGGPTTLEVSVPCAS
ncbi:histidine kinase [Leucobacter sp. UT-8R-CII-1-4]|uniref:sensor histidine kinase n=1 Tax=Leucobacter sp. UT-8R-CII-1-4 TaxID=3040075 RepID=UPI0024A862B4|nr:histidine kinase [Leucobacter sp. UT-8R-CII-1-4]MDI6023895.1 histidine kinase [Leucobacter sp. UT-8R-CII-1-4]